MAGGKVLTGRERRLESKPQNTHKRKQGLVAYDHGPSSREMGQVDCHNTILPCLLKY